MTSEQDDSPLIENVMFIILLVVAVAIVAGALYSQHNGAKNWADITAKELAKVVNGAEPGDKFEIEIHDITVLAKRNEVPTVNETIQFNNDDKEVCVKLSKGTKRCYAYFNEVDIIKKEVLSGAFLESEKNTLVFEVTESKKQGENDENT